MDIFKFNIQIIIIQFISDDYYNLKIYLSYTYRNLL